MQTKFGFYYKNFFRKHLYQKHKNFYSALTKKKKNQCSLEHLTHLLLKNMVDNKFFCVGFSSLVVVDDRDDDDPRGCHEGSWRARR